jgi:hypothetical protein
MNGVQAILFLALLFTLAPEQVRPSPVAAIEGSTSTDGGAPLPGVKVAIDSLTRPEHFVTHSSAAGRYALENIPPGMYTMLAEAKGFGCVIIPKVLIEPGKRVKQDFEFLHARKKLGCETATRN